MDKTIKLLTDYTTRLLKKYPDMGQQELIRRLNRYANRLLRVTCGEVCINIVVSRSDNAKDTVSGGRSLEAGGVGNTPMMVDAG